MHKKILIMTVSTITLFSILLFSYCNKNKDGYYGIPDIYVNKIVNLELPSYQNLNNIGSYVIFTTEGFKGIMLYHNIDNEFIAMDLACTYQPADSCAKVTVDNSAIYMRCGHYKGSTWMACCNSKFQMDGMVLEGPAKYPLKRYQVVRDGNILTITN
jgi:Rieske Fe-S protein